MTTCPECNFLGEACPRHECLCINDGERITVSPQCDEHAHLIEQERAA